MGTVTLAVKPRYVTLWSHLWLHLTRHFRTQTQGGTHLERGQNFVAMLEDMDGGIPAQTTVDFIEGVSHDSTAMIYSAEGIDKVICKSTSCIPSVDSVCSSFDTLTRPTLPCQLEPHGHDFATYSITFTVATLLSDTFTYSYLDYRVGLI